MYDREVEESMDRWELYCRYERAFSLEHAGQHPPQTFAEWLVARLSSLEAIAALVIDAYDGGRIKSAADIPNGFVRPVQLIEHLRAAVRD